MWTRSAYSALDIWAITASSSSWVGHHAPLLLVQDLGNHAAHPVYHSLDPLQILPFRLVPSPAGGQFDHPHQGLHAG